MVQEALDGLEKLLQDPNGLRERIQRMERNVEFALAHQEDWREEHPNHWIAVYDAKLVAAESSMRRLRATLQKKSIPVRDVYLTFLREDLSDFIP